MQAGDETSVADSNEAEFRAMVQPETSDDDFEEADAPVLCSRLVWVNEFAGKGRVYSRLMTGLYYDVNLGAAAVTCSCGVPRVNMKLCAHIAFGCSKFRRSLVECVFIDDTAVRFRQQYAAGGTWPVPPLRR
ncbi:hypothetical protein M885DRAFT_500003 [Pelagophyceae sp. CCMP2097]|nr:hypothetical protein M885DRAFT_500003 [Pelagophyceae sp. CCMP2097]